MVQGSPISGLVSVAHPVGLYLPHDLWTAWNFEPSIWMPILLSVWIYAWGVHNVWRHAGFGHGITVRQWLSFVGAIFALVVTLVSPLEALSDNLFSVHMTQHLILILGAAPLLVMSDFLFALMWAFPRRWAQRIAHYFNQSQTFSKIWRVLSHPISVWVLFTMAMWLWHAPRLYQAALRDESIHTLEHLSYLITALLFWWVLFKHNRPDHVHYGMAIPYLFLTVLQSGILGALMTFTSQPWYPYYAYTVTRFGLTLLGDQQLAGLIMWMPGGTVFTLMTIGYFAAWLRVLEQRSIKHKLDSIRMHQELK